jgi:hypothetical protein
MNEEQFFDRLRDDARLLQFEPDAFVTTRIAARVRERIAAPAPTVSLFLARWLRPIGAAMSAIALAACISVAWYERTSADTATLDTLSANNGMEISVDGDTYSVGY